MKRIDELAASSWSGYPSWVVRRLRRLEVEFRIEHADSTMKMVRRTYAAMNGGDGDHLSQPHLDLLARAWLSVGPRVPVPPISRIPCIFGVMNGLRPEDPLLQDWLVSLVGATLRRSSWSVGHEDSWSEDHNDVRTLTEFLSRKYVRGYWDWLTGLIECTCSQVSHMQNDWQGHVIASRVAVALFSRRDLKSLLRCIDAWNQWSTTEGDGTSIEKSSADHDSLLADPMNLSHEDIRLKQRDSKETRLLSCIHQFVPRIGTRDPGLVFHRLWTLNCKLPERLQATLDAF